MLMMRLLLGASVVSNANSCPPLEEYTVVELPTAVYQPMPKLAKVIDAGLAPAFEASALENHVRSGVVV